MSWTDERIERLKTMWTQGSTASQIAEELGGVSRNAVIGKAHRLGLESRPSPVKAGEEKEKKAKPAPAPKAAKPARRAEAGARRAPKPGEAAADAPRPAPAAGAPAQSKQADPTTIQYRSVGPGGFIRQGPGDTQAPIPPAPPRRLVPAKPSAEVADKTVAARPERPRLPLADGPSRASPISISAASRPTPAIPIASIIAASPTRRSCRAATAARRRPCPSAARGFASELRQSRQQSRREMPQFFARAHDLVCTQARKKSCSGLRFRMVARDCRRQDRYRPAG